MAAPSLSHTAQRFYDGVAPLAYDDENQGWALAYLCQALAATIDEIAELVRDRDDEEGGAEGYSTLWDIDTADEDWLDWIAQFIGVVIPPGLDIEAKRIHIRETDGFKRGTPDAIKGAVRRYLTGDRQVFLVERYGSAYQLVIATYDSETPASNYADFVADYASYTDLAADFATYGDLYAFAIQITTLVADQIPGGIVFEHRVIDPGTYTEVTSTHSDYTDIAATYITYAEIVIDPTK